MNTKLKKRLCDVIVYLLLAVIVGFSLFPVVWMCIISLKSPGESVSGFSSLVIERPTLENYRKMLDLIPFWQNFFNSAFTTVMGTVTSLFFCSLAGFAFAKYKFPGRNVLFYFVVATMLIPPEVGSVPTFLIMRNLNMINSLWSLVVPRMATAIGIFYMRQYITDVPTELVEAARIDGCSEFGIYHRVILPVIKPAIASWGILTVIARWNDFFWPLIFLRKSEKYTLMVSISMLPFSEGMSTTWPVIMAGTTVVVLPVLLVYIILQAAMKGGLTLGSVKG